MVKKQHEKKQGLWYSKHNRIWMILVVLIFAVAGYFLLFSHAAPAAPNVYVNPASQVLPANTTFTVQIRETSGTTAVNEVTANLSYPTTLLSFVSISTTGTAFSTVAQSSGGAGVVNFAGGTPIVSGAGTTVTGDQLVATVTFKTLTTGGAANIAFTSGTILVNASTNTDILGSLANTTGGTFNVDTTPPATSITAPANNATLAGGSTVSVTATATDTQSTVSSVDFYVDGTKVATDTVSPYTYSWNTTGLTLASHTLQAKATDSSGNLGSSSVVTVTLTDQTAPSAPTALHSTGSTYTTIGLAWTASTDNVGVTGYRIQRNGTTITTVSGTTTSFTDSSLAINTSYNYSVFALDAAGNVSTAATLTTATSAQVAGDDDNDGHVNLTDLTNLLANWNTANSACDFNKDGVVSGIDLSILLTHYGT